MKLLGATIGATIAYMTMTFIQATTLLVLILQIVALPAAALIGLLVGAFIEYLIESHNKKARILREAKVTEEEQHQLYKKFEGVPFLTQRILMKEDVVIQAHNTLLQAIDNQVEYLKSEIGSKEAEIKLLLEVRHRNEK